MPWYFIDKLNWLEILYNVKTIEKAGQSADYISTILNLLQMFVPQSRRNPTFQEFNVKILMETNQLPAQ